MKRAMVDGDVPGLTPLRHEDTTWPELGKLPEYKRLRDIVSTLARRYLVRAGVHQARAANLTHSLFNWAAVHRIGEFHGPHTHVGEYVVAVFYARNQAGGGRFRLGDPRGQNPPFGRHDFITPRSGELVIFPSWLSHMATVTHETFQGDQQDNITDGMDKLRVIFAFNFGPVYGPLPCHLWFSDPTGDMKFHRQSKIDLEELGLV
eukprot:TRINITY_DN29271_c0_g2_i2.p1 TRINITY_DN29271_c0_g2~~TRINITY_DN29271_c0_g2_i2.p1  ORF type:complete len:205 (+),score=2.96 TRINITY_DN29271_c0_g2_i2:734-1348(+)